MSAYFQSYLQPLEALLNLAVEQTDEACPLLEDDDVKRIQNGQQSLRASKLSLVDNGTLVNGIIGGPYIRQSHQKLTYRDRKQEEEQLREIEESIRVLHENSLQEADGKPKVLQRKPWTISKPENESPSETVAESMWNTFEIGESDEFQNEDNTLPSPKLLLVLAAVGFSLLCLFCVAFRNREMICSQLDKILERSFTPYYVFRCLWETRLFKEYFSPEQIIPNPGGSDTDPNNNFYSEIM